MEPSVRRTGEQLTGRSDPSGHIRDLPRIRSVHCSSEDPGGFGRHTDAELFHSRIRQASSLDDALSFDDLLLYRRTLEEQEFPVRLRERRDHRDELRQRADGTRGHGLGATSWCLLGAPAEYANIVKSQIRGLFCEPVDSPFHRLDEQEVDVRSGYGKDDSRKPSPAADVGHRAANKGSGQRAVDHMARPQSREFQRTDEPALLSLGDQGLDESPPQWKPIPE